MDDTRLARLTRELGDPEIAGLLVGARREVVRAVPQQVAHRHLTAVLTAVGAIGVAGATSAGAATVSAAAASSAGTSGVVAASATAALTGVKLAATAAAVGVAVAGGLAVTGNLPDPAQKVVADAAERIGIGLPSPEPAGPAAPGQGEEIGHEPADLGHDEPADLGPDGSAPERPSHDGTPPDEARDDPPRREDVPRRGEPLEQPPAAPEGKGSDSVPGKGTPGGGEPGGSDGTESEPAAPVPPPGKSADSQGTPPDDRGGKHTPLEEAGQGRAFDAQNKDLDTDEGAQTPQPVEPDVDASLDADSADD